MGLEANPLAHFASSVKLDWDVDPDELEERSQEIAHLAVQKLTEQGIEDNQPFEGKTPDRVLRTLSPEAAGLILTNSISPLPLHKTLVLLDSLDDHKDERYYRHARLALANALVYQISNLHFGPEVGVRNPKSDAPVVASWMNEIKKMVSDLRTRARNDFSLRRGSSG